MKAAVIEKYGPPDNFFIKDIPSSSLREGQILVKNRASSVNPIDAMVRKGKLRLVSGLFGNVVLGSDFCGTVISSRSNLYKEGEKVYGFNNAISGGAYAEEVVVNENNVAPMPLNISDAEAASLPMVACTAFQGLIYLGKLKEGDHVLINGCTGGVGSMAVQIAKAFHATVTGVCSGKHVDFARALGCDFVINYETSGTPKDRRYDLFFDAAGRLTYSDVKDTMKKNGLFVSTRGKTADAGGILETAVDVVRRKTKIFQVDSNTKDLIKVRNLVEKNKIRPMVARSFPLEQVSKAHEMLEKGGFTGKIAVEIK